MRKYTTWRENILRGEFLLKITSHVAMVIMTFQSTYCSVTFLTFCSLERCAWAGFVSLIDIPDEN